MDMNVYVSTNLLLICVREILMIAYQIPALIMALVLMGLLLSHVNVHTNTPVINARLIY